ncbi:MAG: hypothetical protein JXK93_07825 [Sphaerochaetaceae bacterium]|nr:hypothetical protein [Sphaerochaetaceae bacterium]
MTEKQLTTDNLASQHTRFVQDIESVFERGPSILVSYSDSYEALSEALARVPAMDIEDGTFCVQGLSLQELRKVEGELRELRDAEQDILSTLSMAAVLYPDSTERVLFAIRIASLLLRRGLVKEAVDVLDHAGSTLLSDTVRHPDELWVMIAHQYAELGRWDLSERAHGNIASRYHRNESLCFRIAAMLRHSADGIDQLVNRLEDDPERISTMQSFIIDQFSTAETYGSACEFIRHVPDAHERDLLLSHLAIMLTTNGAYHEALSVVDEIHGDGATLTTLSALADAWVLQGSKTKVRDLCARALQVLERNKVTEGSEDMDRVYAALYSAYAYLEPDVPRETLLEMIASPERARTARAVGEVHRSPEWSSDTVLHIVSSQEPGQGEQEKPLGEEELLTICIAMSHCERTDQMLSLIDAVLTGQDAIRFLLTLIDRIESISQEHEGGDSRSRLFRALRERLSREDLITEQTLRLYRMFVSRLVRSSRFEEAFTVLEHVKDTYERLSLTREKKRHRRAAEVYHVFFITYTAGLLSIIISAGERGTEEGFLISERALLLLSDTQRFSLGVLAYLTVWTESSREQDALPLNLMRYLVITMKPSREFWSRFQADDILAGFSVFQ